MDRNRNLKGGLPTFQGGVAAGLKSQAVQVARGRIRRQAPRFSGHARAGHARLVPQQVLIWVRAGLMAVLVPLAIGACDSPQALEPVDLSASSTTDPPRREVSVDPSEVTLQPGETAQLTAKYLSRGRSGRTRAQRLWESTDPAIASVDATGLVTAHAVGSATIVATIRDVSGTAQVVVASSSPEPPSDGSEAEIPAASDWSGATQVLPSGAGTWPSGGGDWDYLLWGGPSPAAVTRYDGTWYLYYIGSPSYNEADDTPEWRAIGVATSRDGVSFTKYSRNPIVEHTPTPQFEEGAVSVAVLNPAQSGDGKWHMWYGANVSTGGGLVDMQIRYRTSTDGLTWGSDALVKATAGHEYQPIAAHYGDGTYSVYYLHIDGAGGGAKGAGPLRRLHGSSPTRMGTDELVTSTHFAAGNYTRDAAGRLIWQFHVSNTSPGQYQWRVMEPSALGVIGDPVHSFSMRGYYAGAVHYDPDVREWRWYQLFIDDPLVEVRLRTVRQ
jgi:hypothetical protein